MKFVIYRNHDGSVLCDHIMGTVEEQAEAIAELKEECEILDEIELSSQEQKEFQAALNFFESLHELDLGEDDNPFGLMCRYFLNMYLRLTKTPQNNKKQLRLVTGSGN